MSGTPAPPGGPTIADGRYVIVARIGEGGMAGVYRVYDNKLKVWRALKVLLPAYATRNNLRGRFEAEAHAMARLEHNHLVRVYDVGDAGPLPFMVMELVEGGTLLHWIARNGSMPPGLVSEVGRQIASALGAVHAAGVIHRDVKPRNVLISRAGRCKLTDFGIAHVVSASVTRTGVAMGTQGYMAPEQRSDAKSVDARSDIFGLGATLWSLLTGEPANDLYVANEQPQMLAGIPGEFRQVILRCVAYRREDRYASAAQLESALQHVAQQLEPDPPYTPSLAMELSDHDLVAEPGSFVELEGILDHGAAAERSSAAMPYFMPQADHIRASLHDDNGSVPDYISEDEHAAGSGRENITIGIESAVASPGSAPRAGSPPPPERNPQEHAQTPPTPPPHSRREREAPAPQPPRQSRSPALLSPESGSGAEEEEEVEEGSALTDFLSIASVPLALFLAFCTVAVVALMLVFGAGAYELYGSATAALASRKSLYTVLDQDRLVIDHLAQLGADRQRLDEAYLTWLEERGEPARREAAQRFLMEMDRQAMAVFTGEGSAGETAAGHVVRRLRTARVRYEADLDAWSESAAGPMGRALVLVGAGSAPPE